MLPFRNHGSHISQHAKAVSLEALLTRHGLCLQAVLAVKASVETGYSVGQGLMQTVGAALFLASLYLYVLRSALLLYR